MKSLFASLVAAALLTPPASGQAWSDDAHEAIYRAALHYLEIYPDRAWGKPVTSLIAGEDPRFTATWLDRVRDHAKPANEHPYQFPRKADNAEAERFTAANPHTARWHFAEFPMAAKGYDFQSPFARPDDIVHILNSVIELLQSGTSRELHMTQPQAVRVLVNLVGDLHQPLQCSTRYYDPADPMYRDPYQPSDPDRGLEDAGGKTAFFNGTEQNLYSLWQSPIPARLGASAEEIMKAILSRDPFDYPPTGFAGPMSAPALWASDTIRISGKTYEGVHLDSLTPPDAKHPSATVRVTLSGSNSEAYERSKIELARTQLGKAAFHLAQAFWTVPFVKPIQIPLSSPTPSAAPTPKKGKDSAR